MGDHSISAKAASPLWASGETASSVQVLTRIWLEVLSLNQVAPDANFFDIGGDSMKAMEVIARTGEALKVELPLMSFFEDPTIAHLAGVIDELRGGEDTAVALAQIWAEVLRQDTVDASANFFDIGGDSLKAMEMITRVSEVLGVDLPLMSFFEDPTIAHLAYVIDELKQEASGGTGIERVAGRHEFPLSHSQEVFWLLAQQNRGTGLYNTARIFRVRGKVDTDLLERSLNLLRGRHEILRVRFAMGPDGPVQIADGSEPLRLEVKDLSVLGRDAAERAADEVALETVREPFNLESGPVLRTRFAKISDEDALLCMAIHHVVSDGFTGSILLEELASIYESVVEGGSDPLPPPELHFTDYAAWEREWMTGARLEDELAYWQRTLAAAPTSIELPSDGLRDSRNDRHGRLISTLLPREQLHALQALAQANGTTLFTVLAAGLRIMLSRWSGQNDFLIGTIASNRSRSRTERMVGCFVNPLALRNRLTAEERVQDVLAHEKNSVMEAFAHQDCPFAKIVERINPERTGNDNPLFNVALLLQSFPAIEVNGRHFHARDVNFDAQTALIDLRLIATESAAGLAFDCEYSTTLFTSETIDDLLATYMSVLVQMAADPALLVADVVIGDRLVRLAEERRRAKHRQTIAVAANFTAEPIEQPLAFWMEQLRSPARLEFAPFDQIFQQLLDPGSLLGTNTDGISLLLVQWRKSSAPGAQARELAGALKTCAARSRVPLVVCVCPPAVSAEEDVLRAELEGCRGVHVLYPAAIQELYPIENYRDAYADAVGAIPYTPEFFVAAASMVARRIYGLQSAPAKVIALDCDNTLWRGVCGEDGALGVKVDAPHIALQKFMLAQKKAGMLLCLCSKNVEADVDAVFANNGGMLLRREDFVASRINWESKSDNLKALAEELRLGLDSFVLIDDNPLECAEVRANASGAMVLELPADEHEFEARLRQMWAFDHWSATEEDRQRSELYLQEREREQTRASSSDLAEFLRGLELKIDVVTMSEDDVPRVAQLTQRTNQFNCSTLRRSEGEVYGLPDENRECLVIRVADRFGDYGLVGVAIFGTAGDALEVDTFLLSCRALGRRVEHHMLARLCELALARGLANVDVRFAPTAKNLPARQFLESLAGESQPSGFRFTAPYARIADDVAPVLADREQEQRMPFASPSRSGSDLEQIARELNRVSAISRAMREATVSGFGGSSSQPVATATEEILSGIWAALLRKSPVRQDDFFRIGGNSLLAVQVLSRVRQVLGVELPLRSIFEEPTLAAFARRIDASKREQTGLTRPPLMKLKAGNRAPASFAQQRLWFIDQLEPGNPIYNIPQKFRMRGPLNVPALERSLTEIVRRHESLRTTFTAEDGQPVQVVGAACDVPLPVDDVSHVSENQIDAELERIALQEAVKSFDLADGLMLRARLLRRSPDDHVLLIVLHHIAGDRWSAGILGEEMEALYAAFARGEESPLDELAVQYSDFSRWQRSWLEGDELKHQAAYWRAQLAGAPAVLELPTDRPRPAVLSHRGAIESKLLPMALVEKLTAFSQNESATLFMVLLAALQALLGRYSGQDDVVVGSPIAGRNVAEAEPLIGFFVNTMAFRTDLAGDPNFRELLHRVRGVALDAYAHQDIPFERLVEELQPERSLSYQPVFQTIFALQNAPQRALELAGLRLERLRLHQGTSAFDLSWFATHVEQGLELRVEYSTDLFDAATVQRMMNHFTMLLEGIVADPERRISELELLDDAERHLLIEGFNQTQAQYPRDLCLHDLVARQAGATPSACALVDGDRRLTYGELNARANQLAHFLIKRGAGPDVLVGICGERTAELLIAILAILKSGSAYVPLDPNYPADRLLHFLEQAQAPLVLSLGRPAGLPEKTPGDVISLDAVWAEIGREPETNPVTEVHPENLAYVLFTSGSTGIPKGVALEHRSTAAFVHWAKSVFSSAELTGVLFSTSVCFDLSVFEIFATWSGGGKVILAENALYLPTLPARDEVTLINTVPSAIAELLRMEGVPNSVITVNLAGEALPAEIVERIYAHSRVEKVYNLYGPTEDTTYSTFTLVPRGTAVTIGRPIANTRCFVLDQHLRPTPIGMPGELYIAGEGLARGYYGRPEMTAERFVRDPFSAGANARMYRTGDRSRWLATGELEYLGRLDHQVKLRGFRIELGEIEATLNRHAAVDRSIAIVREDVPGLDRLVAYVAIKPKQAVEVHELEEQLRVSLPDYMVPSAIVVLDALPLTANGKVDRKALPPPQAAEPEEQHVAPRNPAEQAVAKIWAEVLHLDQVGVTANFFALGGHSLLATRVIARIRRDLRIELPLRSMFESPTIAGLARRLGNTEQASGAAVIPKAPRDRPLPLSFAQQRMWFLDLLEPGSAFYNYALRWRLRGDLDLAALEFALYEIIGRHEVLRTTYVLDGENPVQVISPRVGAVLTVLDISSEVDSESRALGLADAEAARAFDLAQGPVFRATLLRLANNDHVLILNAHHIAADGWSFGVLRQELALLYNAFRAGKPSPLVPLPIQYPDYAVWQRNYLQGEVLDRQLAFWKQHLEGAPTAIDLLTDKPRPALQTFHGARVSSSISAGLLDSLRSLSSAEGATLFMTLLAAFAALLSRYSGQQDIVIGSAIAGRTQSETEGLIGLFINTLALRVDLSREPSFRELLHRVRATTVDAYAHQDLPFERLVEELNPVRDASRSPLYQVMLVLQNTPPHEEDLPGLERSAFGTPSESSKMDLLLDVAESPSGLAVSLTYNTDLFYRSTAERMLDHFGVLLENLVANTDKAVDALPILAPRERELVLNAFNDTAANFRELPLHRLFEEQVERTPEATAIVAGTERISYAELNQRSNRVAHELSTRGIGPEDLVGVYFARSVDLLVAIFAVLKAGAAYVPLDPNYPHDRILHIIEGAQAQLILTSETLSRQLPEGVAWMALSAADHQPQTNVISTVEPHNLAYVLFTSGSTGKPKGVALEHRNAATLIQWALATFSPEQLSGVLFSTSVCFDLSVFEMFAPLACGGKMLLAETVLSLPTLPARGEVTLVNGVPSAIAEMVRLDPIPPNVKTVTLCGEPLSRDLAEAIYSRGAVKQVINLYGPTEDTTYSTWMLVERDGPVTIGRPMSNSQALILSRGGQLQPVGVAGELFLAGAGLARGYLHRPDLTAERFLKNPYCADPGARMYRTGDLCRWLPNGELDYLGRLDHQVKLRGFRIELGEVEYVLRQHASIEDAVVMLREDVPGDKRLVAYVTARPGKTVDSAALRAHVKSQLPEYMVPSGCVALDLLPTTPNGKVDRKRLPVPEEMSTEIEGRAPETAVQQLVEGIWSEVLKRRKIHLEEDFFNLGGHSLMATQVLARLRSALGIEIPLRAIFEHSRLDEFSQQVEKARAGTTPVRPPITRVSRDVALPLSFAQQRLWFVQRLHPERTTYNMPSAIRLSGNLNIAALEDALNQVVKRHETLRTVFAEHGDEPVQVILPHRAVHLELLDLADLDEAARLPKVQEIAAAESSLPFDLSAGPMFRCKLLRLSSNEHVLMTVLHHVSTDNWSGDLLWREVTEFYQATLEQRAPSLPELTVQYADFAVWQRDVLSGQNLAEQLAFWREFLADAPEVLRIPTDHPRGAEADGEAWAAFHVQHLSADLTERIARLAAQQTATPFMVEMSAFLWLLHRLTRERDIVIGTDFASRTTVEMERLIGFFINLLPVRARMAGTQTFAEFLRKTRESMLDVFGHQEMPFDKLVQELAPERSTAHNPLVQVLFVMESLSRNELQLPEIETSPVPSRFKARFDLSLFVTAGESTRTAWVYNTALFEEATVAKFAKLYEQVLTMVVAEPSTTLDEVLEQLDVTAQAELEAAQQAARSSSADRLRKVRRSSVVA